MAEEKSPCPLCASKEIKLHYSASGVGGQMMTVTAFAMCENCLTVFQDVASSTAGFSLREARNLWSDLPARLKFMREHNEREARRALSKQALADGGSK